MSTTSIKKAVNLAAQIQSILQVYNGNSDAEVARLRDQMNKQNVFWGKHIKTIGVLQKTINGLEEQIGSKKDWVDKLAKRHQEIYELREMIVALREKIRLYENADCRGCASEKKIAVLREENKGLEDECDSRQNTIDDLRVLLFTLKEKIKTDEIDNRNLGDQIVRMRDLSLRMKEKSKIASEINEMTILRNADLREHAKSLVAEREVLKESLYISEQKRLDLNRSFQNFLSEIKRLEKELSEVREIAFGYRET